MKIKAFSIGLVTAMALGASGSSAHAVDVIQEYNSINCRFGDDNGEKQKYCEALAKKPMSDIVKNCLIKAGIGGAGALVVGRINGTVARDLAVSVAGAGATACLSSLV
ncbi:hypothetical protein ABTZ03_44010 [Kitasatospora sp. NPDC096077]|uniref:hypothetical protein n=1 Tax=Kitasatospora sp. NPDC096077 TaxID=3155544 RepID=UPI003332AFFE